MKAWLLAGLAVFAAAPLQAQDDVLARMMRGESAMQGKELERAIAKAEEHPLGSRENPVRVSRPQGQRAYLATLRCSDGKAPRFQRAGNLGPGVYNNIVDLYIVECDGAEPARSEVIMDMYHLGRTEDRPVPGFTIGTSGVTKPRPAGMPTGAPPPPTAPVQTRMQEPTG